jgi:hypothetical protein
VHNAFKVSKAWKPFHSKREGDGGGGLTHTYTSRLTTRLGEDTLVRQAETAGYVEPELRTTDDGIDEEGEIRGGENGIEGGASEPGETPVRGVSETLESAMAVLAGQVGAKGWDGAAVEPQLIRSDQVPPPLTANASCVYVLCLESSGRLYCGACAPCYDEQTASYRALNTTQSVATINVTRGRSRIPPPHHLGSVHLTTQLGLPPSPVTQLSTDVRLSRSPATRGEKDNVQRVRSKGGCIS